MPEALAILGVSAVALFIGAAMWMRARDPKLHRPEEEMVRMRHHVTWLDERLVRARRENWGHEMVAGIEAERDATRREIARVGGGGN